MENYMKLEISALGENESFARSVVSAFALSLNPTFTELSDIKTAVSEAVTNCIVHAYKEKREGQKILIECRIEKSTNPIFRNGGEGVLHIRISDNGCGIDDVEKAVLPFYTTLLDDERSGMGFTIMQTFMDEFYLDSQKGKGTVVTMVKWIGIMENVETRERANA